MAGPYGNFQYLPDENPFLSHDSEEDPPTSQENSSLGYILNAPFKSERQSAPLSELSQNLLPEYCHCRLPAVNSDYQRHMQAPFPGMMNRSVFSGHVQKQDELKRDSGRDVNCDPAYWHRIYHDHSNLLREDEKLLIQMRKIDVLPWKVIQEKFNKKNGTKLKQSALQMRLTRLTGRMMDLEESYQEKKKSKQNHPDTSDDWTMSDNLNSPASMNSRR